MATDYDAPRKSEEDLNEDSIEELKSRRTEKPSAVVDEDETDLAEGYELPGADLSGEELLVRVLPAQADEFTCASCFLVRHRSQIAREKDGLQVLQGLRGLRPRGLARQPVRPRAQCSVGTAQGGEQLVRVPGGRQPVRACGPRGR